MPSKFETQLEHAKLDAMKELAYGASHEINNPLANIAARAQTLMRDEALPDRRLALEAIHQQAMRAHEMISDLMLFARPPALDVQKVDLSKLLSTVADRYKSECARRDIRLNLTLPSTPLEIPGDEQQLEVALRAVCSNAIEAVGTDGSIGVAVSSDSQADDRVIIQITDTGVGMSDEVRQHLFDPFYSGREAGRGLGFGMSKCWRIVTDHGGSINVSSSLGEGTTISLQLPADFLSDGE
ncbi:MAG: HAMP domain-containing sensor histidine kinase [Planctomycetota bacterium]